MFHMVIGEYFQDSLVPVAHTVETFVTGRHHVVKACQGAAAGSRCVEFGIRMQFVI